MTSSRYARPDPSDPVQALAACYARFVLAQAAHPEVSAGIEPDLVWTMTGIPIAGFNRVMGARLTADTVDDRVVEVLDRYRERGSTVSWWVDPASGPADLAGRLGRHGLIADTVETPGMALDLAVAPEFVAQGVDVGLVDDDAGLEVANVVAAEGFDSPGFLGPAIVERLRTIGLSDGGPLRVAVASLGGRAVGTALAFVAGEVAALYNIATVPDARGRGVGATVTLAVCRAAAERGARVAVLESSQMGHPVYRRIGFRDVGSFRILHRSTWG